MGAAVAFSRGHLAGSGDQDGLTPIGRGVCHGLVDLVEGEFLAQPGPEQGIPEHAAERPQCGNQTC